MAATRIYVPRETAAVSVGADEVALQIAREAKRTKTSIQIVRNGSWGATWLEPLVEVEVNAVSYTHLTLPTITSGCRGRGWGDV